VRLGFPEKVLGDGGLPERDGRRWRSEPHLRRSIELVHPIVDYLERHDLRFYRISQALAPYASHPELTQFRGQVEECEEELAALGRRFAAAGIRVTMHTNPFVVLSSQREEVLATSLRELDWQAAVLDALGGGPESVIVVHVGSADPGAADRFLRGVDRLPEHAQARIVLENDDRRHDLASTLALAERAGLRVVLDVMHHRILDRGDIDDGEALRLALATWPRDTTPKVHWSSPKTQAEEAGEGRIAYPRIVAHADLVDVLDFERWLRGPVAAAGRDFDVLVEARLKDLAVLRLREQLAERGVALPGRERAGQR
jgi:UV DNA damage endonuclease